MAERCTNCGAELPEDLTGRFCPTCGAEVTVAAAPGDDVPFEARERYGFLSALLQTWKEACFEPDRFFTKVGRAEGLGAPLLFYLLVSGVGVLSSLAQQLLMQSVTAFLPQQTAAQAEQARLSTLVVTIALFAAPVWIPLTLFLSAAIAHVCLWICGGANKSYNTTFRVLGYAAAPQIFALVPCIGGCVGSVWALVLEVIGLAKAHETDTWRSVLAILLPVVVCCGLAVAIWVAVLIPMFAKMGGLPGWPGM